MKPLLIISLIVFSAIQVTAQQFPMFSQYNDQLSHINPATSGFLGNGSYGIMSKNQWLGYKRAPLTFVAYGEARILKRSYFLKKIFFGKTALKERRKKSNIGFGGAIFSDNNGLLSQNGFLLNYAYHFFMQKSQISLGLGLSFSQYAADRKRMEPGNTSDPLLNTMSPAYSPDFNFGFAMRNRSSYMALSSCQLLDSRLRFGGASLKYGAKRHFFLTGGTKVFLNENLSLLPSIMLRSMQDFRYLAEIGSRLLYSNTFWMGINYRNNGEVIFFAGSIIHNNIMSNHLFIGYACDYPFFNSLRRANFASHEISLRMVIGDEERRKKWKERY